MGAAAGVAAPLAAGLSLASLGMGYQSDVSKADGTKAANDAQAARLERAAEYGRLAAQQTSGQLTERLNTTLAGIDAVRAAGGIDPSSPTTAAIRERQSFLGEREKSIKVGNILAKVDQDTSDADYLRKSGEYALGVGKFGATAKLLGGLGKSMASPTFGVG